MPSLTWGTLAQSIEGLNRTKHLTFPQVRGNVLLPDYLSWSIRLLELWTQTETSTLFGFWACQLSGRNLHYQLSLFSGLGTLTGTIPSVLWLSSLPVAVLGLFSLHILVSQFLTTNIIYIAILFLERTLSNTPGQAVSLCSTPMKFFNWLIDLFVSDSPHPQGKLLIHHCCLSPDLCLAHGECSVSNSRLTFCLISQMTLAKSFYLWADFFIVEVGMTLCLLKPRAVWRSP